MFQLATPRLQVDHCSLTRFAVAMHDDGAYQISFRADQNPLPGDNPALPPPAGDGGRATLQTGHLRRNLFVVRVRGYAGDAVVAPRGTPGLGHPAVVEFPVEPFWVQRGVPYPGFVAGRSEAVRRYFALVERVEVEFTYKW